MMINLGGCPGECPGGKCLRSDLTPLLSLMAYSLSFLYRLVIVQSSIICLALPLVRLPSILPFPLSLSYCPYQYQGSFFSNPFHHFAIYRPTDFLHSSPCPHFKSLQPSYVHLSHGPCHHLIFVYFQHRCQNASQDNVMVKRIS